MKPLADQTARDLFIAAEGKNISVIAPAGVGKTDAIVKRIVALAQGTPDIAAGRLARLIVVTYSVRAAQEMQQRARAAIRAAAVAPQVQRAFQQTFFGTIHSYCVRLLDRFGHYLGLPSPVALLEDHDECWNRFLVRGLGRQHGPEEEMQELFHFYAPEKLYALGREISPGPAPEIDPCPVLELSPLLSFPLDGLKWNTRQSIEKALARVRAWSAAWARGDRFHPLPEFPGTKQADFLALWSAAFAPLNDWLREAAYLFGRRIANAYEEFRLGEALMTYDDQVRLALRLLGDPRVQSELAEERWSVLLDEAQDTDPRQFEVLLRVAGLRLETAQADDQSFCVVGDFQQAIYVPRSDLALYRRIHDEIIVEPRGAASRFEVTFRCDEAIIRFVNKVFAGVLHGREGQSEFFPLQARPGAGRGQVARWLCPDEPDHAAGQKINAATRARHEAKFLAAELLRLGPEGVGATHWSKVALLCPRRGWLLQIARELRLAGLPVQFHSSDETRRDRTGAAWLAALVWILAHPEDSFEIAGVLREIFGVADDAMARFTQGQGDRLRLDRADSAPGPLGEALELLRGLALSAGALPLHRAMEEIVDRTALRVRLRSVAEFEFGDAGDDLDEMLALAAQRSVEGAGLAELAEEFRLGLAQARPEEEEIRDAIQLLTSHKSKGLEWDTVILPYFFRDIERKNRAYPRLVLGGEGGETIYRDKDDYAAGARTFEDLRDRQQLQRLLYVACTRARHTLLFVDDRQLFDGQRLRGVWSSGSLLGLLDGVSRIAWEALPQTLTKIAPEPVPASAPEKWPGPKSPLRTGKDIEAALAHAAAIPRRITPHALAVHAPDEAEPERETARDADLFPSTPGNPGLLYGTWWHEFIQGVPWEKPDADWQNHFERALPSCAQPERAVREWDLFRASRLGAWLREPGRVIHRELPFLWPKDAATCLEGVMDLAVFTPADKSWEIIDWKTNRVAGGNAAALVATYRGQLVAYLEALRKILSTEARGSLYLTASGDWLPMENVAP